MNQPESSPASSAPYVQSVTLGCGECGKPITNDDYHVVSSGAGTRWFCSEHGHADGAEDPLKRHERITRDVLAAVEVLNHG